ncbi:MAG: BamA/TamA family outer membrane protein [Rhodothermales bacterium]
MRLSIFCGLALLGMTFSACTSTRPYVEPDHQNWETTPLPPAADRAYQVFLIGNAGATEEDTPLLDLLQRHLGEAGKNSAVIFLGDNAYDNGLPDSAAIDRAEVERRLLAQIKAVQSFDGRVVFIPGHRDWAGGGPEGLNALARQETFIESQFDGKNVLRPDDGLPGPDEIKLADGLKLVVLDTQWWLHPYAKAYGDAGDYDINEDGDLLLQLDDLIQRNRNNRLLVVGHHPLFSNGRHSGFVPLREHLFPLTRYVEGAYLPLPLIGSLFPFYTRFVGGRQDPAHARYRSLREGLLQRFRRHEDLIYASAHDRNLQYFRVNGQHYVVSGAGSRPEPVARGNGATFTAGTPGFMTLHYYRDGSVWLETWSTDGNAPEGRLLFRMELAGPEAERIDPGLPAADGPYPDYTDSTAVVVTNPDLAAGGLWRFFWGSQRRDAWTIPFEVPYLDMGHEAGGLMPIKRGGGLQSTSLRLQGADGKQYVLRSAKKDPSKALPDDLRKTFAGSISRDQAASQHPFGAYIVPPLAEAAGIYHANPKPVYVPKDPRLGIYKDLVGGQLMLFEERPDDDMSDAPHFGRTEDVVGAPKMYRKVTGDNDHQVDPRALARARLFDMLLSDWDRHVDQWRWATFKRNGRTIYRPIPRDRDLVFNRLDGLFPGLIKPLTKYQDFRTSYGTLKGLTLNAWEQDHRFLSALERSDWIEIADSIRTALTDDVIEQAVRLWPEPVYARYGREITDIFKIRREKLPRIAERFYKLHAKSVDVVGSNKHERFEVRRLNDDETEVVMYKTRKNGDIRRELYRRTFHRKETKEILLYGFGGNDQFEISGEVSKGIMIVAVGGPGEDHFTDQSQVRGRGKKTRFYDTLAGNHWTPGPETKIVRSDDPVVNYYDYEVRYDTLFPAFVFESDPDEGLRLGSGIRITKHHLRKKPYARQHVLTVSYALGTKAVEVAYAGHYVADFGGWDVMLDARWRNADNTHNFFGFGNETIYVHDAVVDGVKLEEFFNQARLSQVAVAPALRKRWGSGLALKIGAHLEITDVRQDRDRFIGQPEANVSARTFDDQWYAGVDAALALGSTDRPVNPRQGVRWTSTASLNLGVRDTEGTFGTLGSELTAYFSPVLSPQVTFATRFGVAHNEGDFPFYHANTLGGSYNLRGYRNERFAGRTSVYQNVELRLGLTRFSSYLALGEAGVIGFLDNGRVWYDGESSSMWHQGYGGGLWASLFGRAVLTATLGFSEEDEFFKLQMGFLY